MTTQAFLLNSIFVTIIISSCTQHSFYEEYNEKLLTYPYSDTNPFPVINNTNEIYPYSRIDGFSHIGKNKQWKIVKLENEYIEVYILPENGGKVWGAIDKVTGKEFIYKNDVVKYRDVALRGPWTSGGIEWNSGVIGHHVGTAAPVNYTVYTDNDGTAHCVIGGMDLPSHMQWRVDLALPAKTSYFEATTNIFNTTPFYQPYYSWSNAAVKCDMNTHFYFPGNYWLGHDGVSHPWPVDENGIDRSWYRNNPDKNNSSYHVLGSIDNFFVSYNHDEDFGTGHWSESFGTPGKKIWMFSQARVGGLWEDLLTDTSGQFAELQSGRMFNQNSFSSAYTPFKQTDFSPYNTDSWTERWFPVRGTDGATRVTESGTVHLKFEQGGLNLLLSPIREINDKLVVTADGKEIVKEMIVLKPSESINKRINGIKEKDIIAIYLGKEKLFSSNDNYMINRPTRSKGDALHDRSILAGELEKRRSYHDALEEYMELIENEPYNIHALERVAELYYRRGEFDKALYYTRNVLEINAYSPAANYIYANLCKLQGNFSDAEDGLIWAMRSMEYRSASLQLLSEIRLMQGNMEQACNLAVNSLDNQKSNLYSYKIQAIAQRKMKNYKHAANILDVILKMDPLNHFARFEKFLIKPNSGKLSDFNISFKSEMAREEYLELGLFYTGLGLRDEAIKVLKQAPLYPITLYWLAWLNKEEKQVSQYYLEMALEASPDFVFPYRTETLMVLDYASKESFSWITDYYSALILWNRGRNEEALDLLEKWSDEPTSASFYYTRACLKGLNSEPALKDMEQALAVDPDQWRIYRELTFIYGKRNEAESALAISEEGHNRFPGNFVLDLAYAKSLTNTGKYIESLTVLNKTNVLPYEGERAAYNIYAYNYMMLAYDDYLKGEYNSALAYLDKSELYPENLGRGKPVNPDYRNQNILRIKIYNKTGDSDKARDAREAIGEYSRKYGEMEDGNVFEQEFTDTYVNPF